jgi:hypothetical protein
MSMFSSRYVDGLSNYLLAAAVYLPGSRRRLSGAGHIGTLLLKKGVVVSLAGLLGGFYRQSK